jgi:hypothetical protein
MDAPASASDNGSLSFKLFHPFSPEKRYNIEKNNFSSYHTSLLSLFDYRTYLIRFRKAYGMDKD